MAVPPPAVGTFIVSILMVSGSLAIKKVVKAGYNSCINSFALG